MNANEYRKSNEMKRIDENTYHSLHGQDRIDYMNHIREYNRTHDEWDLKAINYFENGKQNPNITVDEKLMKAVQSEVHRIGGVHERIWERTEGIHKVTFLKIMSGYTTGLRNEVLQDLLDQLKQMETIAEPPKPDFTADFKRKNAFI